MRTYGRVMIDGVPKWQVVTTDNTGQDDYVYVTTLAQVLKGNLGESPFYAQYGIPAIPTVVSQVFPDYYMALTQSLFAGYFASLILTKLQAKDARGVPYPYYDIQVTTHQGVKMAAEVPV